MNRFVCFRLKHGIDFEFLKDCLNYPDISYKCTFAMSRYKLKTLVFEQSSLATTGQLEEFVLYILLHVSMRVNIYSVYATSLYA